MEGCYVIGGQMGRTSIFDIAAVQQRLKEMDVYMNDEDRETLAEANKLESRERGRFNNEMKKYNSKARLYKSPLDDKLVKLRNTLKRVENNNLKKEIAKVEVKLEKEQNKKI